MQGDYEGVLGRLRMDKLIQKFLLKMPEDENYQLLCDSMEAENWDEVFRAAHTMKGVCANLGLSKLQASSSELTEAVRGGKPLTDKSLFEKVREDYAMTIGVIEKYKASLEG